MTRRFRHTHSSSWLLIIYPFTLMPNGTAGEPPPRAHSNVERLSLVRLAAVHDDVQKLKTRRVSIAPLAGLIDYRCILHAHAEDSAHTGGTLPEMLADAKKPV